ncbi:SOS response-associated peptidase [Novosphingobium humi]|uniref:SOS response-associated peptidase n=1 Tax=Novosphingobium humi TaxID=2282397 RepID=UPI0025B21A07|nr:SOS response-associated peptidase family protein [Novosphingobium humi]WJS98182.1 SOS response-associated peptidase [Novosphingobium humi]
MCNLYRMRHNSAEIARLFRAEVPSGANYADEVYPGYPGLVTAHDQARVMHWGFPVVLTGRQGQKLKPKPVTNARDDKLHTPFWRASFEKRRCLIPVSQWAEPEGEARRMTRTWYSLPGGEPFAVAGLWRPTDLWGKCYTMVMVPSCEQMAEVHDRMPVILRPQDWDKWLDGAPHEAFELCRTWRDPLLVDETDEPWAGRAAP